MSRVQCFLCEAKNVSRSMLNSVFKIQFQLKNASIISELARNGWGGGGAELVIVLPWDAAPLRVVYTYPK